MVYLLGEIATLLAMALALGLAVGWLLWRWRQRTTQQENTALIAERDEQERLISDQKAQLKRLEEDIQAVRSQSTRAVIDRDGMEDRLTSVLIENSRLVEQREDLVRQVTYFKTDGSQPSPAPTEQPNSATEQVKPDNPANEARQTTRADSSNGIHASSVVDDDDDVKLNIEDDLDYADDVDVDRHLDDETGGDSNEGGLAKPVLLGQVHQSGDTYSAPEIDTGSDSLDPVDRGQIDLTDEEQAEQIAVALQTELAITSAPDPGPDPDPVIDLTDEPPSQPTYDSSSSDFWPTLDEGNSKVETEQPAIETETADSMAGVASNADPANGASEIHGTASGISTARDIPIGIASQALDPKPGILSRLFSKRRESSKQPSQTAGSDPALSSPQPYRASPEAAATSVNPTSLSELAPEPPSALKPTSPAESALKPTSPAGPVPNTSPSDLNLASPAESAPNTPPSGLSPGPTERDDLTKVQVITPALDIFLHNEDIWTYRQLGSLTDADIDRLQNKLPEHPDIIREQRWIEQARHLYNEKYS